MILKINGNIKAYYVQQLAMIFFPGIKFPEREEDSEDGLFGQVDVTESGNTVTARVTLARNDDKTTAKSTVGDDYKTEDLDRRIKIAVGEAFNKAGAALTGFMPPWGILTGVRPSKVAMDIMEKVGSVELARDILTREYCLTERKSALVTEVALAERRLITPRALDECSVYIGIPFCPTRCAYCSFVSYTSPRLLSLIPDYLTRLCEDVDRAIEMARAVGKRVSTVYIGGGTPTILTADQLDKLLSRVSKKLSGLDEFTLEAGRPDTITEDKLIVAASHGVDRMSVNPQSLNDEVLRSIGRAHDTAMFYRAYETARKSGIKNINVDLIAGLPGDTAESFRHTVDGISALQPENVTVHTFSVKKSAELREMGAYDRDSRTAAESVDYAEEKLPKCGYLPYYMYRQKNTVGNLENVGYSKPDTEGLYNIYMMEEIHSIFSAGASSVTKLVSRREGKPLEIERIFRPKYPYEYLSETEEERNARFASEVEFAREFYEKFS